MAYSDYGGYGYRNGQRIIERSDAVLSSEGLAGSTPGSWPGWTLPEGRDGHSFHVVLGDGPLFVTLYKSSCINVYELTSEGLKRLDTPDVFELRKVMFEINGYKIEAETVETDNYYTLVRLTQPDGAVWTGFSGYGVGAGLEDCGYGYSTSAVEQLLEETYG